MKAAYKKMFSAIALSMFLGLVLVPSFASGAPAAPSVESANFDVSGQNAFVGFDVGNVAGDPRDVIKRIINVVMGFLGMIAVLIILFAGFKWMTAAGNKENMESAQKLLVNGIIGLVIIFSAWTVAWFVVNMLRVNVGGVGG